MGIFGSKDICYRARVAQIKHNTYTNVENLNDGKETCEEGMIERDFIDSCLLDLPDAVFRADEFNRFSSDIELRVNRMAFAFPRSTKIEIILRYWQDVTFDDSYLTEKLKRYLKLVREAKK